MLTFLMRGEYAKKERRVVSWSFRQEVTGVCDETTALGII